MAGKSHRKGISLAKISQLFATEEQSREWLENRRWTKGVSCPFCKGKNVVRLKHPTQTHRCKDCRNKKHEKSVQCENRYGNGTQQYPLSYLGNRDISIYHQHQRH